LRDLSVCGMAQREIVFECASNRRLKVLSGKGD
jgi:hypothetical protein